MSLLQVKNIGRHEEGRKVLQNISFIQPPFQRTAIAGATGSGKTSLLRIIAGLLQPSEGEVLFEGTPVKGPGQKLIPGHPSIAYLSQHFELRNHYRVQELLEINNKMPGIDAQRILELCRIGHLNNRWTHQLSGGEKQRIALALLLVTRPRLLLLDEPYSNLDIIHKNTLKAVIENISSETGITCILVAHEPSDILSWADHIIILQEGKFLQQGSPEQVYSQPINEYAAALFGRYTILTHALAKAFYPPAHKELINQFIRPEGFKITDDEGVGPKGTVRSIRFMGSYYELEVEAGGTILTGHSNMVFPINAQVTISLTSA
jgi:ABC-type Fe3+/spermidine/putrescine transport system ATPase subunit